MKILLVAGGLIQMEFARKYIEKNTFDSVIAIDRGLLFLNELNKSPDYIIGDFDSLDVNLLSQFPNSKVHTLNPHKDYTDTHMALELAFSLQPTEITIIGATGNRLDHMIANVYLLSRCLELEIFCKIIDEKNEMFLINKDTVIEKDNYFKYVSLLPFTDIVTGITLQGFLYPLENKTLTKAESIGISNELLEKTAYISLSSGILIVVKSKD